jgi:glycosyltransferase involved in cell wall biosynthesis
MKGPKAMKILQIFNKYVHEGGEEKSVDRIFRFLSGPHSIRQVSFDSSEWASQSEPLAKLMQAVKMFKNPASIKVVKREIEEFTPDYILVHNIFPVGSASLLNYLSKLKIPVVYYVHNFRPFSVNGYLWAQGQLRLEGLDLNFLPEILDASWQDSRFKTFWYAMVLWVLHLRGTWKRLDHWIAISDFMKETFVKAGIPAERISVVRHSWRVSADPIEKESFREEAPFVFFGRLSDQKGVILLLEAWKIVSRSNPRLRIVICGEGPLEKVVQETCKNTPSMTYAGFLSGMEKADLLRRSRCLVAPSIWYEPLGLVVYEGYEYSLPVIAASSGGLAETVMEGETGFLVNRGDTEDLASAMLRMVSLPDGGVAMGKKGREWLEKNTTEEEWNRRISNVFGQL